jgi:hypothetical protein
MSIDHDSFPEMPAMGPPPVESANKQIVPLDPKQYYGLLARLPHVNENSIKLSDIRAGLPLTDEQEHALSLTEVAGLSDLEALAVLEELQEQGKVSIHAVEAGENETEPRFSIIRPEKRIVDPFPNRGVRKALGRMLTPKPPVPTAEEQAAALRAKGRRELTEATFRDNRMTQLELTVGPLPHIEERNAALARREAVEQSMRQRRGRNPEGPVDVLPGFSYIDVSDLKDVPPQYRDSFTDENLENAARTINQTISDRFKAGEDYETAKEETVEAYILGELGPDAPTELKAKYLYAELVAGRLLEKRPRGGKNPRA